MRVTVDKAALDALIHSAVAVSGDSTAAIAKELKLDELVPEAVAAARPRRRAKAGESHIDPAEKLVQVVIGVPDSLDRHIKAQVTATGSNVQVYTRAVLLLAMRAGLMDQVTQEMAREQREGAA